MSTMTKRICPFCGSMHLTTVEADIAQWAVVCDRCYATGPSASSQILASEKWNGTPQPLGLAVEFGRGGVAL